MASDQLAPVQRERAESGGDLLASLTKEAQHLRSKLEEEKRKLYDADCTLISSHFVCHVFRVCFRLNCCEAFLVFVFLITLLGGASLSIHLIT